MHKSIATLALAIGLAPLSRSAAQVTYDLDLSKFESHEKVRRADVPPIPQFDGLAWILSGAQEMGVDSVNFGLAPNMNTVFPRPEYSLIDLLWPISQDEYFRRAPDGFTFNIAFTR
jgi:hypothetical protein